MIGAMSREYVTAGAAAFDERPADIASSAGTFCHGAPRRLRRAPQRPRRPRGAAERRPPGPARPAPLPPPQHPHELVVSGLKGGAGDRPFAGITSIHNEKTVPLNSDDVP